MYKVVEKFVDLTDNNRLYRVNDVYPREGLNPSEDRIALLCSNRNKLRKPVISVVVEKSTRKKSKEE